jgi:hypothetical protein
MKPEQKKFCEEVGKGLLVLYPHMNYGNISVKFNIKNRQIMNFNVSEESSIMLIPQETKLKG